MRPYAYATETARIESEKPDWSVNGCQGWTFVSDGYDKTNKNGQVEKVGVGAEMVLLELSTQDGKKRYEAMSLKNLQIWLHNLPGILSGIKNLAASKARKAEEAKANSAKLLAEATTAIIKAVPTLKAAGLTRSAIVSAMLAQHQNLTAEQVEAVVPTT